MGPSSLPRCLLFFPIPIWDVPLRGMPRRDRSRRPLHPSAPRHTLGSSFKTRQPHNARIASRPAEPQLAQDGSVPPTLTQLAPCKDAPPQPVAWAAGHAMPMWCLLPGCPREAENQHRVVGWQAEGYGQRKQERAYQWLCSGQEAGEKSSHSFQMSGSPWAEIQHP